MDKSPSPARRFAWFPLTIALVSLWPLLQNLRSFRTLLYFEDEWDLIDLWDKTGFFAWVGTIFAESFVPLFKLLWGGAIVVFGGDYFGLVTLLWLTHAANVFLLVRIATRLGADRGGAALAGLVFGLTWINYETLAWTVQWSAVLSLSFLLLGVDIVAGLAPAAEVRVRRLAALLAGCALASALCFSRGVLTGLVLAGWALLEADVLGAWPRRVGVAVAAALPACAVAWWISHHALGNHLHVSGHFSAMASFAFYYYAESPLRLLFSQETPAAGIVVLLALAKTAIFAAGFVFAPRRSRHLLLALIAFELGNAMLLGLGRYHTGLDAAGSSRYQYGALAVLLPFIALLFSRILATLPEARGVRSFVAVATVGFTAWWVQIPWRATMNDWCVWRGGDLRRALFATPPAQAPDHFTRLPWMTNERARELTDKYHLH